MKNAMLLLVSIFIGISVMSQVPSYVPTNGLVGYWPFNGNANDESGNGNNGVVNGATLTSDRFGNVNSCYSFNGASYIQVNNWNAITGNSSFTVSFWTKPSQNNNGWVLSFGTSSNGQGFEAGNYGWGGENFGAQIWSYNYTPSTLTTTTFNNWTNITIVYSNNNLNAYKNGILVATQIVNYTTINLAQGILSIGKQIDFNEFYNGSLDDISIYNRALTQSEITGLYNAGTNTCLPSYLPTNGLVGYWPFCGNANDESGNGNNGVVNGATLTTDRFGDIGKAYSFNGANFISVANSNSINFTNQFTLSAWMNSSSLNSSQGILGKGQNLTQTGYALLHRVDDNQTGISLQSTPIIQAYAFSQPNQIGINNWNLITGTYDGTVVKLYVNGLLVSSMNSSISLTPNPLTSLFFGCELPNFRFFNGSLDDIGIWNRALTASEVQNLYNASAPTICIANITTTDTTICSGSSITLNAASITPAPITDINGNVYPTVNIGSQTWMQKNLNVSRYKNGDIIPQVTDSAQWANLTTGAWCWFNNDSATYSSSGKLYNWYAINDSRGIAPDGWHVPADGEWNKMIKYLDPSADTVCGGCVQSATAGGALKQTGTTNWLTPNGGASNSSGFNAISAGFRENGNFLNRSINAYWWSATTNPANLTPAGWTHVVGSSDGNESRISNIKPNGYSVRLVGDNSSAITYLWSTGATTQSINVTPLVTTTYYCTVSNGISSCMDSVTVTVTNFNPNLFSQDTIKACGAAYTLNAGSGYTSYLWSTGATTQTINATNTGWYKCTVSNGTCSGTDSVFVSIIDANIENNDTTICRGGNLLLTATGNASAVSSLPINLRNGLVGYWPFNGNANDESGNGNNGVVNGAYLTFDRNGNINSAYNFNNNDIRVNIPNSLFSSNFTISTWIYLDSNSSNTNYPTFITEQNSYLTFQIEIWPIGSTPKANFYFLNNYQIPGLQTEDGHVQANLFFNKWINLVLVNSAGINKLFVDNNLVATSQTPSSIQGLGNGSFLKFGNGDELPQELFIGKMDDISIWNRALTFEEVQQLSSINTYSWSTGATTQNITVSPTQTTTYYCTVSNGISSCTDSVTITVKQPTTSTTNSSVCSNQLPYTWNGVAYNTSGSYNKTLVNAAGCDSVATLNLTVKQTSSSTTSTTACGSYVWNGVTYTSSGTYSKVTTNAVGCDSTAILNLTLTTANNSAPSAITGARNISKCDTLQNYSVLPMTGVTFTWTVTGTGNSVKTGQGTNTVVMVMKVAGTISVKATNACGTVSSATTLAVTKATPATPGTISQSYIPTTVAANTNACLFTQTAFATTGVADTFRIRAVANATGYIWKAPTGSTVTRVNDTTIAVVFANTITVPDSIKVYSLSACNTSLVRGLALVKTTAAAPANILKTDGVTVAVTDVCPNVGGSVTYKVRKVATAISYNWYMTRGTKATITHINPLGVNDTAVIVTYQSGFTADSINVSCTNGCGTSAVKLLKVSAILLPPTPSTITASTGNFYPCPTNTVQYTVASPAATTAQSPKAVYRWTRPANTNIIASNADSSVITIRFESNYAGGSLSVKCQTACGIQGTAKSQTFYYTPPTPTGINSGSGYNVCIGSTVSLTCSDPVSGGSGEGSTQTQTPITMHRWTRPNFTNITSATADSGTISLLIQTGFTGGNVTAKCQSPCGANGSAKSQALTHTACPAGTKNSNANTGAIGSFDVNIFPNPTKSAFNLQVSSTSREAFSVKVFDVQGRLIKTMEVFASEINNIGNDLKSGVYMFEITQGKEKKTVRGVKY